MSHGDIGGIAGDDVDVGRRQSKLITRNLRQHRPGTLPHRRSAGVDRHLARTADADGGRFERTAPGALDAVGYAKAEVASFGQRGQLARWESFTADRLQGHALTFWEVAAVVFDRRAGARFQRRRIWHGVGRNQIPQPDLGTIDSELSRGQIKQPFHRKRALRISGAADRHCRHLVGLDRQNPQVIVRQPVGSGKGRRRVVRHVHALRCVGALIVDQRAPDGEQFSVRAQGDLQIPILVALLNGRQEMLTTILDPLDRPPEQARRNRHHDFFRIDQIFRPEAAADIRGDDTQFVVVEPQELDQSKADFVRALRRAPDRRAILDPSYRASTPRPSIGCAQPRWCLSDRSKTCAASANARSQSP